MTFFADLCHLQQNIAAGKDSTHRKLFKIKTFHDQIFTESAILNHCAPIFKIIDALCR